MQLLEGLHLMKWIMSRPSQVRKAYYEVSEYLGSIIIVSPGIAARAAGRRDPVKCSVDSVHSYYQA